MLKKNRNRDLMRCLKIIELEIRRIIVVVVVSFRVEGLPGLTLKDT